MEDRRLRRQKREATQLLTWHLQTPYLQPETNFSCVVSFSMQKEQLLASSPRQLKQLQSRKRCTKLFLLFGRKKEAWLRRTYSKILQQPIYFPLRGIDDKNGSKQKWFFDCRLPKLHVKITWTESVWIKYSLILAINCIKSASGNWKCSLNINQ